MTDFKTRGYAISTTLKYCREGVDPERRERVLERISPDLARRVEALKPTEWYPTTSMNELFGAIVAASDGDAKTAERDLIGCGRFAASEATNTFLRLVMRVLTPNLFAKKLPSMYARDNSKGIVQVDVTETHVLATFKDTSGFDHLAPMSAGWMMFALESMGKVVLSNTITQWSVSTPDVPAFSIEVVWKT